MVGYFHNNKHFSLCIAQFFRSRSQSFSTYLSVFLADSPILAQLAFRLPIFQMCILLRAHYNTIILIHFAHPNTVMVIVNSCTANRFKAKWHALFFFLSKIHFVCILVSLAECQASGQVSQQACMFVYMYLFV